MLLFNPVNITLLNATSQALGDMFYSLLTTHLKGVQGISMPETLCLQEWSNSTDQQLRLILPDTLKSQLQTFRKLAGTMYNQASKKSDMVISTIARLNDELTSFTMQLMVEQITGEFEREERYYLFAPYSEDACLC